PEYWLAREADQPFIDFSDEGAIDAFIDRLTDQAERRDQVREWGGRLQTIAMERYTIEHMASVHVEMFREIAGETH
ncbi:MAG: hypothetical protein PF508_21835, partial [Spirochaeta sp.]|nr:hypothetical protein [Spirochaeta sp.]